MIILTFRRGGHNLKRGVRQEKNKLFCFYQPNTHKMKRGGL